MRDLIVFGIVVLSLPLAFRRPFIGLLMFSWLAYMRPQDLCWGFARHMRLSFYVGLTMIAGYIANDAGKRPFTRWDLRTGAMLILLLGTYLSTSQAKYYDEYITAGLIEYTKIIAVAMFTAGQIDSKERLRTVLWCFALCLGFFGFKGGLYGLITGGSPINRGPGGMMEDNNDFALALVMGVPMLWYLAQTEPRKLLKRFALLTAFLTCITIILTHSRGGFVSMCLAAAVITWRSGKLIQAGITVSVLVVLFFNFAPQSVKERYITIGEAAQGEEDSSVGARYRAWTIGMSMVEENPILGVGHKNFRHQYPIHAQKLFPGGDFFNHVAHNSYVQVWAESGTPAFIVFMTMMLSVFYVTHRLRRMARGSPQLDWVVPYANMSEAVMAGFMFGAFFLNRGHFDLSYHFIAVVTAMLYVAQKQLSDSTAPVVADTDAPSAVVQGPERPVWGDGSVDAGSLPVWGRAR